VALFGLTELIDSLLSRLLGPAFHRVLDQVRKFVDHVTNIFGDSVTLIDSIKSEIDAWRNFREDVRVKSRVINVPSAFEATKALIVGIGDSWRAIIDIVKNFKEKLNAESPAQEAEDAAADLEEGGIGTILKRLPKLAKFLEKALGILAIVVDALDSIVNVIQDLQTIVDEIKRVREEIESAESLFLQQKNPRRIVQLADGTTMKIRVGKLHS
jgi:hypothetical protein